MAPIIPAWNAPGLNIPAPQPLPEDVRNPIGSLAKALEGIAETQRQRRMDEAQLRQQQMQAEIHRMKMDEMRRAQRSELDVQGVLKDVFTTPPTVTPLGADTVAFDADEDERDRLQQAYQRLMSIAIPEARQLAESLKTKVDMAQQRIDLQQMRAESAEKAGEEKVLQGWMKSGDALANYARIMPGEFEAKFKRKASDFLEEVKLAKAEGGMDLQVMADPITKEPRVVYRDRFGQLKFAPLTMEQKLKLAQAQGAIRVEQQKTLFDYRDVPEAPPDLSPAEDYPGYAFSAVAGRFYRSSPHPYRPNEFYMAPTDYTGTNPPPRAGVASALVPPPALVPAPTPLPDTATVTVPMYSERTATGTLPLRLGPEPKPMGKGAVEIPQIRTAKTVEAEGKKAKELSAAENTFAKEMENDAALKGFLNKVQSNVALVNSFKHRGLVNPETGEAKPGAQTDEALVVTWQKLLDANAVREGEFNRTVELMPVAARVKNALKKLWDMRGQGGFGEILNPAARKMILKNIEEVVNGSTAELTKKTINRVEALRSQHPDARISNALRGLPPEVVDKVEGYFRTKKTPSSNPFL